MLHFDPAIGFYADEIEDVRSDVASAWQTAFANSTDVPLNTDPESPAGQLVDSQTAAIVEKDTELLYLCNQFDPAKNEGVFQDAIARIYFLTRKGAVPSSAVIKVTGLPGTVIPVSAQIQSTADGTLWQNQEAFTIGADGTATGTFSCLTDGAVSALAGTLTQIVTVVAGWDTATNDAAAVVGSAAENRGSFEQRRYESVALNSRGTASAVYARLMQIDNVISVCIRENKTSNPKVIDGVTLSPHSVFVCVLGGAPADIADALYRTVSAGCDFNGNTSRNVTDEHTGAVTEVKYEVPAPLRVYVRAKLSNLSQLSADLIAQIQQAVYDNFYGNDPTEVNGATMPRYKMGDTIYATRFSISIQNLGVTSLLDLDVSLDGSSWSDSVYVPIDKNPTLLTSDVILE